MSKCPNDLCDACLTFKVMNVVSLADPSSRSVPHRDNIDHHHGKAQQQHRVLSWYLIAHISEYQ